MFATYSLTEEQEEALRLFKTGENLVIEAAAGAGKTSTLKALAKSCPERRGIYLAFNTGIVKDASLTMPDNVQCINIHKLAMGAVGGPFRHRLNQPNMQGWKVADAISLYPATFGGKRFTGGHLASFARKMVVEFCKTAEREITVRHLPYVDGIDTPDPEGHRTYFANREMAAYLLPYARKIWEDAIDPRGQLPYRHDYYLKLFELSDPQLNVDFCLVDEAQDLAPVFASIVAQQRDTQLIYVGDSAQQIYEFTGAINALANLGISNVCYLTKSFRFGDAVAAKANMVLSRLEGNTMVVRGSEAIESIVQPVDDPDVILTRTNATAIVTFLRLLEAGKKPFIVGKIVDEVVSFARACLELQKDGKTYHPELQCFNSWSEVTDYVRDDPDGKELALLVKLVDEFGAAFIVEKLSARMNERDADVVICTAHKSKGLEWPRVQLAEDFPQGTEVRPVSQSEYRLLYVALTRAQEVLDISRVGILN